MSWWFLRSIRFVSCWVFINLWVYLDPNILSPKWIFPVFGTLGMIGSEICFAKIFKDDKKNEIGVLFAIESVGPLVQLLGYVVGLFVLLFFMLFIHALLSLL